MSSPELGVPEVIEVRAANPASAELWPLIEDNQAHGAQETPTESDHTFGVEELCQPGVSFFAAYQTGVPLGCGAYKALQDGTAEVKSVFVSETARGQGLARRLMDHLAHAAQAEGFSALVLETGSPLCPGYDAARALYERLGYSYCAPFEGYKEDPLSVFMCLPLTAAT
ncbi:GNAT family N-acetyltransferase [Pseudophaeobacter sp.]|uniref:GNAT family N-acetyltransferase n=1 Tax=Pseudophaeobacter sp. TaxID=1971739 RepID=UPI0032989707